MELNTYRLNSLEEPTDAQLHALMEQVAMSAREYFLIKSKFSYFLSAFIV